MNYELLDSHMEHPTGDSMTVPNDAMSIPELMSRNIAGYIDSQRRQGFIEDEDSFDAVDLESLDRLDLHELSVALDEARAGGSAAALRLREIEDEAKARHLDEHLAMEAEKARMANGVKDDKSERKGSTNASNAS